MITKRAVDLLKNVAQTAANNVDTLASAGADDAVETVNRILRAKRYLHSGERAVLYDGSQNTDKESAPETPAVPRVPKPRSLHTEVPSV